MLLLAFTCGGSYSGYISRDVIKTDTGDILQKNRREVSQVIFSSHHLGGKHVQLTNTDWMGPDWAVHGARHSSKAATNRMRDDDVCCVECQV